MELSAFAHLTRRNVKVIQPGLVYVIEWAAGGDAADQSPQRHQGTASPSSSTTDGTSPNERARKHQHRTQKQPEYEDESEGDDDEDGFAGTIYVAYVVCTHHMMFDADIA